MALFIDSKLKEWGYARTKDYLRYCSDENVATRFMGYRFYESFAENGILIPESTTVRIMNPASGSDQFYYVSSDLRLEGADDLQWHRGPSGLHEPREKLSIPNAPGGWELGGRIMLEGRMLVLV